MAVMYLTVLERQNKLLVLIFFFFYKAKIQGIDSLVLGTVLGFCLWEFPQCRSLFILPVSHTSAGFALCLILIPNL